MNATSALKSVQSMGAVLHIKHPRAVDVKYHWDPDFSHTEDDKRIILNGTFAEMVRSQIVIWDHQIYEASQRGSDAFIGGPIPEKFCKGADETWVFANDNLRCPPSIYEPLRLPDYCFLQALIFSKQVIPRITDENIEMARDISRHHFMEMRWMEANEGKRKVDCTAIIAIPKGAAQTAFVLSRVSQVIEDGHIGKSSAKHVAAFEFMNSVIATTVTDRPNHDMRKQYKRLGIEIPEVRSVVLRRNESKSDKHTHGNVDWACHWLVRGHWRKLHEPRKSDGATVTYVQPHVKGPEDMPFRAPRDTVYVAKR